MQIAEILSNVLVRLGYPTPELLPVHELHHCLRGHLALRTQQIAYSDQNQIIASATFTPTDRDYDLSGVLAPYPNAVEAWVEERVGETDHYRLIDVVNLANLERFHGEGRRVCSFYGDEFGARRVAFGFAITGDREFRLWFDPHSVTQTALTATSQIPGDLNILVELETASEAIGKIILNLLRAKENETDRGGAQVEIAGWTGLRASIESQIPRWEAQYDLWLSRARGAQVSGNLPRKLRKGLFV